MRHDHIRPYLNINAKIFVPRLLVLSGIRIISAILIMIFNIFLVIIILVGKFRGATYCDASPQKRLKLLKNDNPLKLIIGHLNINSNRNKHEGLSKIIINSVDICLISETKLNDSFPQGQFLINTFHTPFRKDRTDRGGGLLLYIREDIPCREIIINIEPNIEAIFVEINLKKRKWLIIGGYNPEKSKISDLLTCIESKLNE